MGQAGNFYEFDCENYPKDSLPDALENCITFLYKRKCWWKQPWGFIMRAANVFERMFVFDCYTPKTHLSYFSSLIKEVVVY